MKIQDYRTDYYFYTGKTSDIARTTALAGIAVIWLFKKEVGGVTYVPPILLWAGLGILVALFMDLAQYFTASCIWRGLYRSRELSGWKDVDRQHPPQKEYPILALFWGKLFFLAAAYVLIAVHMSAAIRVGVPSMCGSAPCTVLPAGAYPPLTNATKSVTP